MAYRYHPKTSHWRTQIAIEIDGKTSELLPPAQYWQHSIEDPRWFVHGGKLHLSVTVARSRVSGQSVDPCIVGYGEIIGVKGGVIFQTWIEPKHADNVWSKQTKNLVFESSKQGLLMTWATHPKHTVHLLDDAGKLVSGWVTE